MLDYHTGENYDESQKVSLEINTLKDVLNNKTLRIHKSERRGLNVKS